MNLYDFVHGVGDSMVRGMLKDMIAVYVEGS